MEAIVSVLERAGRYLSLIRPMDVLDVAIIAYLVYKILCLVRSIRAENILKGVAIFLVALWLSSPAALNLRGVNYILSHMVEWGVLALIILFQPEIRQLLEKVGSRNIRLLRIFQPEQQSSELERAIDQTVVACTDMAKTRTGVLIVFERKLLLDDIVRSGTTLDAAVSSELLKNIFFVKAPMHDGAVIIRQGRILGAGCMLPLSKNVNLSRDLGMRHRAGIGMSENSDAVVVIVSEETGSISVAIGGMLKRHLMPETLRQLLCNCKPAFDHPVVPHEILPFFPKSLIQDLKILGGTATCSHPFTAGSLDILLIAFLHGTDHILAAPHGFPRMLSPADLSLITSGTYSRTGVRYDTVQLSSAQKFLTVRHSVECIRKLPEGCCIPFHFFLLGMAFTKRQHFFFFLRFSLKDSFCHVPEYQQYADYEHGNDPFLHIFPSPYNLH